MAREYVNPAKGQSIRLPTLALPVCSPLPADTRSIRSVFWHSEVELVPPLLVVFSILVGFAPVHPLAGTVCPTVSGGRVRIAGHGQCSLKHYRQQGQARFLHLVQ